MNQKNLFTKDILWKRMHEKAEEKRPSSMPISELNRHSVTELAIEVLVEEINEIRQELRRKI